MNRWFFLRKCCCCAAAMWTKRKRCSVHCSCFSGTVLHIALFKPMVNNRGLRVLKGIFPPLMQMGTISFSSQGDDSRVSSHTSLIQWGHGNREMPVMAQLQENTFFQSLCTKVLVSTYFVLTLCLTLRHGRPRKHTHMHICMPGKT